MGECRASDGSDRTRDDDANKVGTVAESPVSDGLDRVRDGDAGEAGTMGECRASDGSDRVRDVVVIRAFTTRIYNDCLYILIKQNSIY